MKKIINKFLIFSLLLLNLQILPESLQDASNFITKSINNSGEEATLSSNKLKKIILKEGTFHLNMGIEIPFSSIKENLAENTLGELYYPKNSLWLNTKAGVFALWKNETGILCAKKNLDGEMLDTFDNSNNYQRVQVLVEKYKASSASMMGLLLFIDSKGRISLQKAS